MRCTEKQCFRLASFGPPGEEIERCEIHRNESDVNPVDIVCEINKCHNKPVYGDGIRRYRCGSHRKYTDVKMGRLLDFASYCIVHRCPYKRKYGINGYLLRCELHKLEGDTKRTKPHCVVEGCKSENVVYKKAGNKTSTHCHAHRQYGQVSSNTIVCTEEECFTSARFGNTNDGIKLHCYSHREIDEINLSLNGSCEAKGCIKYRTFGPVGKKKMRCEDHSVNGDVGSVFSRECQHPTCLSQPSFGPPGGIILTCSKHLLPGYVNLKAPMCGDLLCNKIPTFGKPNGPRVHCSKHAAEGEINLVRRKCSTMGCDTQPTFGPAKWKRRRCVKHKKKRDIYAVGKRIKHVSEKKKVAMEDSLFYDNLDNMLEFDELGKLDDDKSFSDLFEDIDKVFDDF